MTPPDYICRLHAHAKIRQQLTFIQVAQLASEIVHDGQRFNNEPGKYYTHPEWVATRVRTQEAKVLAYCHDIIEEEVKRRREHWQANAGKIPGAVFGEEAAIKAACSDLLQFFACYGYRDRLLPLIPDLDALTKHSHEGQENYVQKYGGRLIAYVQATGRMHVVEVKLADLDHNQLPERNRHGVMQTDKDKARESWYKELESLLRQIFPKITLKDRPLARKERILRDEKLNNGHARDHRDLPKTKREEKHRPKGGHRRRLLSLDD